eukprot:1895266-Rhodomonas_salina.1
MVVIAFVYLDPINLMPAMVSTTFEQRNPCQIRAAHNECVAPQGGCHHFLKGLEALTLHNVITLRRAHVMAESGENLHMRLNFPIFEPKSAGSTMRSVSAGNRLSPVHRERGINPRSASCAASWYQHPTSAPAKRRRGTDRRSGA